MSPLGLIIRGGLRGCVCNAIGDFVLGLYLCISTESSRMAGKYLRMWSGVS